MDAGKLAIPLLAFAGGAILGRVFGLKPLVRGAMTAVAVTGMTRPAMLEVHPSSKPRSHGRNGATGRRKGVHRAAHRRSPQKKSAPV